MEYRRAQLGLSADTPAQEAARYWRKFRDPVVLKLSANPSHLEFSPAAPHDLAVTAGARVAFVSAAAGTERRAITKFKDLALSGSFRRDGRLLVAGGVRPLLQIFDLGSRAVLRTLAGHTAAVHVARFAADGTHLFSSADDCSVRHWDMSAEVCTAALPAAHGDYARCGQASAASPALFVSGSYDHSVRLWDFRAGGGAGTGRQPLNRSSSAGAGEEDEEEAEAVANDADSDEDDVNDDADESDDEADAAARGEAEDEDDELHEENGDSPSGAGAAAAAASSAGAAARRAPPTPLPGACALSVDHGCPVTQVLLLPGGGTLLTAGGNYIRAWDLVAGGRMLAEAPSHLKLITALALDATGTRLLSGGLDGLVKVHELATFSVTHTMRADAPVLSLALSPDNAHLALACADASLTVRHRAAKVEEIVTEAKAARLLRGGTYRYFMRGQSSPAAPGDVLAPRGATPGGAKRRRLALHDRHLRAFDYAPALDAAVASNDAVVVAAVLEELVMRDGLRSALTGRDEDRLAPTLAFLVKHIANPKYAPLLLDVAERACDGRKCGGQPAGRQCARTGIARASSRSHNTIAMLVFTPPTPPPPPSPPFRSTRDNVRISAWRLEHT